MHRFVILEHDHPSLHWDFMLEAGPTLRTWRLAAQPQNGLSVAATESFEHPHNGLSVAATESFEHRRVYLDYEGPVSGGRGQVHRWDAGIFSWESQSPERLVVRLDGERLRGRGVLAKTDSGEWSFLLDDSSPPIESDVSLP
jgi:hypothetical protein